MTEPVPDWRLHGVRVVRAGELDRHAANPGMNRAAAIDFAKAGAQKLWAGTVTIHPDAQDRRASSRRLWKASYT